MRKEYHFFVVFFIFCCGDRVLSQDSVAVLSDNKGRTFVQSIGDGFKNAVRYFITSKDTNLNTIQMGGSYMYLNVPYKGFFRNNELFNVQGKGIQVNYLRRINKNNKHWNWGFLFGYEWYQLHFYDLYWTSRDHRDSAWKSNKYKYAEELIQYTSTGTYTSTSLHDTMMKYFGDRWYNKEAIRVGYILAYSVNLTKKFSVTLSIESSGVFTRSISRLSGPMYYIYGSIWDVSSLNILPFTPVYPIFNMIEKIRRKTNNGLVKYNISFQYDLLKQHSLSIIIGWANLLNVKYTNYLPEYEIWEGRVVGCLGCPFLPNTNTREGHISIPLLLNTYKRIQISAMYNYKF